MTIFALSTAPGRAGIAVFRISGEKAREAMTALTGKLLPEPRRAALRPFYDPRTGDLIDRGILLWFRAPQSFTGEDLAELHVHGGRAVIDGIASTLSHLGLRLAEPGEFTKRAFENGKIDLTEVEGLADLINAETAAQRNQALAQTSGRLSKRYEAWRTALLGAMALVEASIDFSDEADIAADAFTQAVPKVEALRHQIRRALDDSHRGEIIREGIQVAIVGAPNAGKSSLLNAMAGRAAAIVFDRPGTTRDVIEVSVDLGGFPFVFRDTAGLRETGDEIELEGIRRTLEAARSADIILIVTDATSPLNVQGKEFDLPAEAFDEQGRPSSRKTIILLNKIDIASSPLPISDESVIAISAKTGLGLDNLKQALLDFATTNYEAAEPPLVTRARHRQELEKAEHSLGLFLEEAETGQETELVAERLREAADALGRLTGRLDVEDVLGRIFSDFCIGK